MRILILLSQHLNEAYIKNVKVDQTILALAKEQFKYVYFHQFRIIYHISASEHFAKRHHIDYFYEDSFKNIFKRFKSGDEIIIYHPNDIWLRDKLLNACEGLDIDIQFLKDINFYFPNIEKELGKPPYKLDPLYRKWRKRFNVLMDGDKPLGGQYSYDQENRKRPPKRLNIESPLNFDADEITKSIIKEVKNDFKDHPKSNLDFSYPVTKEDSEQLLSHFIEKRMTSYGKYQDAMMEGEPFMVHSLLSASINLGLLLAKDVVALVEKNYRLGNIPIEAAEGFIRQILGWREYIRGVYLVEMKVAYLENNYFEHKNQKPEFLYKANVSLNCLNTVITETIENAYNHHIQRLMIIGNILTLMGVKPLAIREWFLEMYIDSFDWVVTPNVMGMATYADGGQMSTKPYISSANYINKMSNYCKQCKYNPKEKTSELACPINALYYHFLLQHEDKLKKNPRMKFMYSNLDRISKEDLNIMVDKVKTLIEELLH